MKQEDRTLLRDIRQKYRARRMELSTRLRAANNAVDRMEAEKVALAEEEGDAIEALISSTTETPE